eukprot:1193928-Prorocentrum_minimum.AAC.2
MKENTYLLSSKLVLLRRGRPELRDDIRVKRRFRFGTHSLWRSHIRHNSNLRHLFLAKVPKFGVYMISTVDVVMT